MVEAEGMCMGTYYIILFLWYVFEISHIKSYLKHQLLCSSLFSRHLIILLLKVFLCSQGQYSINGDGHAAAVGEGVCLGLFMILILDDTWTDRKVNSRHYLGQLVDKSFQAIMSFQT